MTPGDVFCQPDRASADSATGVKNMIARQNSGRHRQDAVHIRHRCIVTPVCFVEKTTMQTQVAIDSPQTAVVVVCLVEVLDDLLIVWAHAGSLGLVFRETSAKSWLNIRTGF